MKQIKEINYKTMPSAYQHRVRGLRSWKGLRCKICGALFADRFRLSPKGDKASHVDYCPNCLIKIDRMGADEWRDLERRLVVQIPARLSQLIFFNLDPELRRTLVLAMVEAGRIKIG